MALETSTEAMDQKPSENDKEGKSKFPKDTEDSNTSNKPASVQYPPMNMFVPPQGHAMVPPGYPYYSPAPW
jgi:hypothetical protein